MGATSPPVMMAGSVPEWWASFRKAIEKGLFNVEHRDKNRIAILAILLSLQWWFLWFTVHYETWRIIQINQKVCGGQHNCMFLCKLLCNTHSSKDACVIQSTMSWLFFSQSWILNSQDNIHNNSKQLLLSTLSWYPVVCLSDAWLTKNCWKQGEGKCTVTGI